MIEVEADQLKETVERMHGGTATFAQNVPIREAFEGKTVWEGVVHMFDLTAIRPRPVPMPGPRQSREARSGDSSRCCISRRSIARKLR
jgi:hypothetical protein